MILQRRATNPETMQEVIRQVQVQMDDCGQETWNPVVNTSETEDGQCFDDVSATNNRVGGIAVPLGLRTNTPARGVQRMSGRDSNNNIIIYFELETDPAKRPPGNALCWLYRSQRNWWDANYLRDTQPDEGIGDTPTGQVAPLDTIVPLEEGEAPRPGVWHHLAAEREGLNGNLLMMLVPGEDVTTIYGCAAPEEGTLPEATVIVRYADPLPEDKAYRKLPLSTDTKLGRPIHLNEVETDTPGRYRHKTGTLRRKETGAADRPEWSNELPDRLPLQPQPETPPSDRGTGQRPSQGQDGLLHREGNPGARRTVIGTGPSSSQRADGTPTRPKTRNSPWNTPPTAAR